MSWWFDSTWNKDGQLCLSHVGGFNVHSLWHRLRGAGFFSVVHLPYGKFSPQFVDCDNPGHAGTSLYMEAVK